MSSIQNYSQINLSLVSSSQGPSYDPLQQEFLKALATFEADLKAAALRPYDPNLIQKLMKAGADLQSAIDDISKSDNNIAKAMLHTFMKAVTGNGTDYDLQTFIRDCSKGNSQAAEKDLNKIIESSHSWNLIEQGLDKFNSIYPYPLPPSTN